MVFERSKEPHYVEHMRLRSSLLGVCAALMATLQAQNCTVGVLAIHYFPAAGGSKMFSIEISGPIARVARHQIIGLTEIGCVGGAAKDSTYHELSISDQQYFDSICVLLQTCADKNELGVIHPIDGWAMRVYFDGKLMRMANTVDLYLDNTCNGRPYYDLLTRIISTFDGFMN
jgi:hypothetical protein